MTQPSGALPSDPELWSCAATDPEHVHRLVRELAGAGPAWRSRQIAGLVKALADQQSAEATAWAIRCADEVASLGEAPERTRPLVRQIAWQLVQRPNTLHLGQAFEKPPTHGAEAPEVEFRACLLYEMALRWGLQDEPYLSYARRLQESGHPLAWLPTASLGFESSMRAASMSEGGRLGTWSPAALRERHPEVPPTGAGALAGRGAQRAPDGVRCRDALRPFTEFALQEAVFYELPAPIDAVDFNSALLAELDADCLAGQHPDTLATVHTTADDVAHDLFLGGFSGGLRGEAQWGAYSRLHTWRSLYALMDLDFGVSRYDAVRCAADHRWLRFSVEERSSEWFACELTDSGFAVLDPSRSRLAVIAVTETD